MRIAEMVRGRPDNAGQVGVRVYPTKTLDLSMGLGVRTWLKEEVLDYVTIVIY